MAGASSASPGGPSIAAPNTRQCTQPSLLNESLPLPKDATGCCWCAANFLGNSVVGACSAILGADCEVWNACSPLTSSGGAVCMGLARGCLSRVLWSSIKRCCFRQHALESAAPGVVRRIKSRCSNRTRREEVRRQMASDVEHVAYDPHDLSVHEDPYPHYDKLRARCPVVYSTETNHYVATEYETMRAILMDNVTFGNEGANDNPFGDVRVLVTADDPAHRRHRKLIARAFTPKRVASMEPYAERVANELIDAFVDQGACDIVEAFAYRLPVAMIAGMLGIPEKDHSRFRQWADDLFAVAADPSPEVLGRAMAALGDFAQYILAQAEHGDADAESLLGEQNVLAALRLAR